MNVRPAAPAVRYWPLVLAATATLMVTMGIRQSMGLFVSPIGVSTGLGIAQISFALAVAQLVWGIAQPLFGAMADHAGSGRVLVLGGLLLVAGTALVPLFDWQWGLLLTLGVPTAMGAGAGSFSVLIGAAARHVPAHRRSMVGGIVNAGGSFGQFLFAPFAQAMIAAFGWAAAMWALAAAALSTVPLAWPLRRGSRSRAWRARRRPGPACARSSRSRCATAATGACTWVSSPAACTSPSW